MGNQSRKHTSLLFWTRADEEPLKKGVKKALCVAEMLACIPSLRRFRVNTLPFSNLDMFAHLGDCESRCYEHRGACVLSYLCFIGFVGCIPECDTGGP